MAADLLGQTTQELAVVEAEEPYQFLPLYLWLR